MDNQVSSWRTWCNTRYTIADIEAALERSEAALESPTENLATGGAGRQAGRGARSNVVPISGALPAGAARAGRATTMLENAKAGLGSEWHWLDNLTDEELDAFAAAIAADPRMQPLADVERSEWLRRLFGFAALEAAGATGACEAARTWSKTSSRYLSDADFDRDWRSYDPARPDGITVGTLVHYAKTVGVDLEPWRDVARARELQTADGATVAQKPARGAPMSQLPDVMDAAAAMQHLNARFFTAIRWGKAPTFGRFDSDGSVHRLKRQELEVALAGHYVEGKKPVPAAKWWFDSSTKTRFDRVLYDPENRLVPAGETALNLWTGFAVQPRRGTWRRMRRHIWRVICGRDPVVFKYFIRWLAFCVQFPGTNPEIMVVLRSDLEGVGKSSVGQWFLIIFGHHGLEVTNYKLVFGDFNELIENKSFFLLEEPVFPGDHQAANILKAMITAREITINPKGIRGYSIPNSMHTIMNTTGKWAIPAGADARRFLMLDVEEKMARPYFDALWNEADNGGVEAMLFDLLRVDLEQFNPREVPVTAALIEQQDLSADSIAQWITEAVTMGALVHGEQNDGFNAAIPAGKLRAAYLTWCNNHRVTRPESAKMLGDTFRKMGLKRSSTHNPAKWLIPDSVTLQAASDKRSGIRRRP